MSNGQFKAAIEKAQQQVAADGYLHVPQETLLTAVIGEELKLIGDLRAGISSLNVAVEGLQSTMSHIKAVCPYPEAVGQVRKPSRKRRIGVLALSIPVGAGAIAWLVEHLGKLLR